MRLDSVTLENYRCHRNLTVDFSPSFNVIVGVNGSGKTSVLKGICEALEGFLVAFPNPRSHFAPLSETDVARVKTEIHGNRYRFESQYPVTVAARARIFDRECVWSVFKPNPIAAVQRSGTLPASIANEVQMAASPASVTLPLIAFYRANRKWQRPAGSELQAAMRKDSRVDAYTSWSDAAFDSPDLQMWAISKGLERFQASSEAAKGFDDVSDDELALVNSALSVVVEGAKGLRYDLKQKSLLVEWVDGQGDRTEPTAFENLSDGQRVVVGLVTDIARRMCLLNPHLGMDVLTETPGVVLIDELDIHLHPRWQRNLVRGLKEAFPKIQFITASHSPQILGELRPDEIILLLGNGGGVSHPQVSYGVDSSRVLEEIMGASPRSPDVEEALSNVFLSLERNDLEKAREQLDTLKSMAPGIAEIAGAEALLKRKEVLGR